LKFLEKQRAKADGKVSEVTTRKPESIFFDSNIYINLLKFPKYAEKLEMFLQGAYLYVVNKIVLMELWAGAKTKAEETILNLHQQSFSLVGLQDDCFIAAGQIMRKMANDHAFEPQKRRRLTWDLLIALSAKENNSIVITENGSDFRKIQKYVDFKFITLID
jgi:predicted nucleic acid-binding protein